MDNDKLIHDKLDILVFSHTSGKDISAFSVPCRNISEAEEIQTWLSSLDGVSK